MKWLFTFDASRCSLLLLIIVSYFEQLVDNTEDVPLNYMVLKL